MSKFLIVCSGTLRVSRLTIVDKKELQSLNSTIYWFDMKLLVHTNRETDPFQIVFKVVRKQATRLTIESNLFLWFFIVLYSYPKLIFKCHPQLKMKYSW